MSTLAKLGYCLVVGFLVTLLLLLKLRSSERDLVKRPLPALRAARRHSPNRTWCDSLSTTECCKDFDSYFQSRYESQRRRQLWSPLEGETCRGKSRLLLIIIFNSALYAHVPLLMKLYQPIFPDIVMYGPENSTHYNVRVADGLKPAPQFPWRLDVMFMHSAITQATVDFPDFDGYLWVADDQLFNYRRVLPLMDPSKVWMALDYGGSVGIFSNRKDWQWPAAWGLPAVQQSYPCIPKAYLDRTVRFFQCSDCVTGMLSDFGYIPQRLVADFQLMSYAFRKVHFEIAIPTALFLICQTKEDFQVVDKDKTAIWLWSHDRVNPMKNLTEKTRLLHPVKLTDLNAEEKEGILKKLNSLWGAFDSPLCDVPWLCTVGT